MTKRFKQYYPLTQNHIWPKFGIEQESDGYNCLIQYHSDGSEKTLNGYLNDPETKFNRSFFHFVQGPNHYALYAPSGGKLTNVMGITPNIGYHNITTKTSFTESWYPVDYHVPFEISNNEQWDDLRTISWLHGVPISYVAKSVSTTDFNVNSGLPLYTIPQDFGFVQEQRWNEEIGDYESRLRWCDLRRVCDGIIEFDSLENTIWNTYEDWILPDFDMSLSNFLNRHNDSFYFTDHLNIPRIEKISLR
jgi:hypothetical protein